MRKSHFTNVYVSLDTLYIFIMYLNFRFHVFFDPAELRMSVEKFLAT